MKSLWSAVTLKDIHHPVASLPMASTYPFSYLVAFPHLSQKFLIIVAISHMDSFYHVTKYKPHFNTILKNIIDCEWSDYPLIPRPLRTIYTFQIKPKPLCLVFRSGISEVIFLPCYSYYIVFLPLTSEWTYLYNRVAVRKYLIYMNSSLSI